MSDILQYTLSLQENLSTKLQNIGVASDRTLDKFARLEKQSLETAGLLKETGGAVGALRERLNLLRAERDWIPAKNLKDIRTYNSEIHKLERNINKLETINGSRIKKWGKEAFDAIPGASVVTNPLVLAATAIGVAGKAALNFDDGMAKVNVTAELSKEKLAGLKTELVDLGQKYGAEMSKVPQSFESILSVVGEVNPSLKIFETSLKGAKATGADLDVVSKALASTKSILNDSRVSADEVLNTFLAAKRVGAGEFSDFASYMPGLIASAGNLGIEWKQATGLFSYMTTKVASAADASVLMQNVFTAFGKSDVQQGLAKEGVQIFNAKDSLKSFDTIMKSVSEKMQGMTQGQKLKFVADIGINDSYSKKVLKGEVKDERKLTEIKDKLKGSGIAIFDKKGSMRQIEEIMGDLQGRMKGMSDEQKSNFLESVGLRDAQAKQGIAAMVSDPAKLGSMMKDVQGSPGEIDAALNLSKSGMQEIEEMWARLQAFAIKGGGLLMTVLTPVLSLVNIVLGGIADTVKWVADKFEWMATKVREGNPYMVGLATILGIVATKLMLNYLWTKRLVAAQKIKAIWDGIVAVATKGWAAASTFLSTTLWANPITWVVAGVIALIAVIGYVIYKTTGWGEAWQHVVNGSKLLFGAFVENVKYQFSTLVDNLMIGLNNIKRGWISFKSAMGIGSDAENDAMIAQLDADTKRRRQEIIDGKAALVKMGMQGVNEFILAGKSIKVDDSKTLYGAVKEMKSKLGMGDVPAEVKPESDLKDESDGNGGDGGGGKPRDQNKKNGERQAANETIATGGTKNTTIHLTIGKQVETVTINAMNGVQEGAARIRDIIVDEMTRALSMAQSLA